jgi:2-amino-4-hydroxy-6-hydroxymethyldihydropteridine diphosphokinase
VAWSLERAGWVTDARQRLTPVAIALGANLGDREGQLQQAVQGLSAFLDQFAVSSFHDTVPVGVPHPQPNYLNAAVVGITDLDPHALLARLLAIERSLGRRRPHLNAPRTLDLDLILYGDVCLDTPSLTVPHPRFRERAFVLRPLAEIAPAMVDPVTGQTVAGLLRNLAAPQSD